MEQFHTSFVYVQKWEFKFNTINCIWAKEYTRALVENLGHISLSLAFTGDLSHIVRKTYKGLFRTTSVRRGAHGVSGGTTKLNLQNRDSI